MSSRGLAGLVSLTILGLVCAATITPAQADPGDRPPAEGPVFETVPPESKRLTEAEAMTKAEAEDRPVEVSALTTETQRVVADPDSGQLVAEISALPVRVERADQWLDVDTTLEQRSDGTAGPAVAPVEVVIDHGSQPFVEVRDDGYAMSLSWPQQLPEPELHGDIAVWPNIAPGIDLAVEITVVGARQYFVVRSAAAASSPLLSDLRLDYDTDGLSVSERSGGFVATASDGEEVFSSSQLRMWEAPVESSGTDGEVTAAALTTPQRQDARASDVGLRVTEDQLLLSPDQEFLADPATRFPVVIDPAVSRERSA